MVDASSHEIALVELTPGDVGNITAVPDLLDQVGVSIASVIGDGAYDADGVSDKIGGRHPGADVIIPP